MSRRIQAALLAFAACLALPAAGQDAFVAVGTGGITGVYYSVGGALCRLLNQGRKEHGLRCTVEATGGSIANIEAIASGELDAGLAQSDQQRDAIEGLGKFAGRPVKGLRALFSLHAEPFTVVARKAAGITRWEDLRGKRVNLGDPGSGTRAMTELVMKATGLTPESFRLALDLRPAEMAAALCDDKLDAFTYVVGHPNAAIREAATACATNLVEVAGPAIDELMKANASFPAAIIPGRLYAGTPGDVRTLGPRATFVTSDKLSEKAAYALVKAVFDNLDEFRKLHPALAGITPAGMLSGHAAPFHPGALRYFREKGLAP